MNPANIVNIIKDIKEQLTLDGKNKVFNEGKELHSEFMKEKAEPEAFTKEFLIDKILDALGLEKLPEKSFETHSGYRSVDYRIKSKDRMFLVEAKPLNADLFEKSKEGGVNQIKGLFKLAEVKENYDFGVATDGLRWVFVDKVGEIVEDLRLEENFEKVKEFLVGKEKVVSPKTEEEISKKFYDWYNALLHGGRYKDHKNKLKTVSEADCLVNNVSGVKDLEEREQIAQVVMNRLIFIKFLQSKGVIKEDILHYLSEVKEDILTPKLRQLFFGVLNTPKDERFDVNERFKDIPYLNGSLFVHTGIEKKNVDYKIKAEILKKVIESLDSFKFVHKEQFGNEDSIDPEILGYIFERAMTATDRKGTGAYYTPRQITRYISENTIYPYIINKANEFLRAEKGYKDTELIKDIEKLFILPATTLEEIWKERIQEIRVLDNACGSGAFLLAAANILFDLNRRIDDKLGLGNSDIGLKKWILMHNLYGVDINPSGIEVAKLRLFSIKKLLYPAGMFGFIHANPAYCQPKYKALRHLLKGNTDDLTIINFAIRPQPVFKGVMQRTAITICRKDISAAKRVKTSRYIRLTEGNRNKILSDPPIYDCSKVAWDFEDFIPKIGNKEEYQIFKKVVNHGKSLGDILNGEKGVSLFYHDSGESYWTKLLTYEPRGIRDGKEVRATQWFDIKVNREYADFVTCAINSTLFYWFWLTISDCRHLTQEVLKQFPIPSIEAISTDIFEKLKDYAQKLMECYKANSYYVGKRIGYKSLEFKVNRCKKVINEIDRLIGEIYGLTDEEIEYLIGYDLEMRTEGD
ncbi:MAG: hypothetical protein QMD80_06865 [archaeon]|nr:hypothetical protein [archaeon]